MNLCGSNVRVDKTFTSKERNFILQKEITDQSETSNQYLSYTNHIWNDLNPDKF